MMVPSYRAQRGISNAVKVESISRFLMKFLLGEVGVKMNSEFFAFDY